ncbi:hypothetical protein Dimus_029558 [Dionaea muscipula]
MGKGGRHIDQSFQVLLGRTIGESDVGPSGVRKKKITRIRKKKTTTEVALVAEREVPTEASVGENEVEAEAEDSDEETEIDEDTRVEETTDGGAQAAAPIVSEEGQKRKRRLKKETETGPTSKKARIARAQGLREENVQSILSDISDGEKECPVGEGGEKGDDVDHEVEVIEIAVNASSPSAVDMNKEEQREKGPSELLVILVGSNGGMSQMLRDTVIQRDGKGIMVEDDKADEEDENEEDATSSSGDVAEGLSTKRVRMGILRRHRLRIPTSKMLSKYVDVLLGSTTRGAKRAIDQISWKFELTLIFQNIAENKRLKHDLEAVKRDFDASAAISESIRADVDIVTQENQSLERKNEGLQTLLEK